MPVRAAWSSSPPPGALPAKQTWVGPRSVPPPHTLASPSLPPPSPSVGSLGISPGLSSGFSVLSSAPSMLLCEPVFRSTYMFSFQTVPSVAWFSQLCLPRLSFWLSVTFVSKSLVPLTVSSTAVLWFDTSSVCRLGGVSVTCL